MDVQNLNSSYTNTNSSTKRTSVIKTRQSSDDLSVPKDPAYPKGPIGSESVTLEKYIKQEQAKKADAQNVTGRKDLEQIKKEQQAATKEKTQEAQESLEKAKELINKLSLKQLGLSFKVDKDLDNRTLISVKDKATDDVVRQIPSEEFVRMAKAMNKLQDAFMPKDEKDKREVLKGLILDNLV